MAETFLEAIGMLQSFGLQYLFVPMLVFVIVFGVLMRTKILSEKMDINGIVALVFALITAMNPMLSLFFYNFLPVATALMLIMFAGILLFMFFGATTEDIAKFFGSTPSWIFFIIIFLVFFMMSLTWTFPGLYPETEGGGYGNYTVADIAGPGGFVLILASPRVLGLISFLLLVGIIGAVIAYSKS
jgi:hypothetical protein